MRKITIPSERAPMAQMSWQYIAGFFDGEGHVSLGRQQNNGEGRYSRGNPRVTIVQTLERGKNLFEEIKTFLANRDITSVIEIHREEDEHARRSYRLRITGFKGVIAFLAGVFPYLRIKKLEAQDLLRYDKVFPTLVGKGHSHSDNVKKAWETRRSRYGGTGYKDPLAPSRHAYLSAEKRWGYQHGEEVYPTGSSLNETARH